MHYINSYYYHNIFFVVLSLTTLEAELDLYHLKWKSQKEDMKFNFNDFTVQERQILRFLSLSSLYKKDRNTVTNKHHSRQKHGPHPVKRF